MIAAGSDLSGQDPEEAKRIAQARADIMAIGRALVTEALTGSASIMMPEIAKDLAKWIARQDAVRDAIVYPAAYSIVQQIVAGTRDHEGRNLVMMGDQAMTIAEIKEQGRKKFQARFANWLEHCGRVEIRLMDMTRDDLLIAAEERRRRAGSELTIAFLWEDLHSKLREGQKVREVFTPEQIEDMYSSIRRNSELYVVMRQRPNPADEPQVLGPEAELDGPNPGATDKS